MKRKKIRKRVLATKAAEGYGLNDLDVDCVLDALKEAGLKVVRRSAWPEGSFNVQPADALVPGGTVRVAPEAGREPTTLICQLWYESEAGWGQRPDGYTLHLTTEDHAAFVKDYFERNHKSPVAPAEYTTTSGPPKPVSVPQEVSWEDYDAVRRLKLDGKLGKWFSEYSPESRMKPKAS